MYMSARPCAIRTRRACAGGFELAADSGLGILLGLYDEYGKLPCLKTLLDSMAQRRHEQEMRRLRCLREKTRANAFEIKNAPLPVKQYIKGMKKCKECGKWREHSLECKIMKSKFSWHDDTARNSWYIENRRRIPDHVFIFKYCVTNCVMCDDYFPVSLAETYGICFECNQYHHKCVQHKAQTDSELVSMAAGAGRHACVS